MDKEQTPENLNPKGHFSPKLWALEYRWEGKQSVGLLQSREEKTAPWGLTESDGQTHGGRGGGNQNVCSQTGALGYPSLAIWTAQVTSSFPRVVAYTSFSSLTFALGFSEHWGGERTCPQVKAAQLKFPPKLSGCSLGFGVTAAIIWCTSTPKWATWTLAGWVQGSHDSQPDKNLLSRQKTIPKARKELYTSHSESLKHGNPPNLREQIFSNEK